MALMPTRDSTTIEPTASVPHGRPAPLSRSQLRADTPGCQRVTHLNNAGASLPPRRVVDRIKEHLELEAQIGGYEAAQQVRDEWQSGRETLGRLVGAPARNVALVESTTVGFHRVLSTLNLHRGDRVLVAGAEYASTVLPLLQLGRRMGVRVQVVPDADDGSTDAQALRGLLDEDVRLVCAVHAPSHNGLVNDVAAIGRELRASGSDAWYLVDACQSLGQLDVTVTGFGCDFLVASGRKFLRGPRGTGLLAVSDRVLAEVDAYPVDVSGADWLAADDFRLVADATRFESFERSVALNLGLMVAAGYALDLSLPALQSAIGRNAEYLRSRASSLEGWRVLDRGAQRSGIVTLRHDRLSAGLVVQQLRQAAVNAWEIPPTMNPRELGATSVLRLSPHAYNTPEELDRTLNVLAEI